MTANATEPQTSTNQYQPNLGAWNTLMLVISTFVTAITVALAVARALGASAITNPQVMSSVIVCVGCWLGALMIWLARWIVTKIDEVTDDVQREGTKMRAEYASTLDEYGHRERSAGYTAALINTKVNGSNGHGLYPVR